MLKFEFIFLFLQTLNALSFHTFVDLSNRSGRFFREIESTLEEEEKKLFLEKVTESVWIFPTLSHQSEKQKKGRARQKKRSAFRQDITLSEMAEKTHKKVQEGNRESEIKKKEKQQREVIITRDIQNNNTMKGNGKNSDLDKRQIECQRRKNGLDR